MGTNYYAVLEDDVCNHCGRGEAKEIHIGKSSSGWCFSLHVASPSEPKIPSDLNGWRELWKNCVYIRDEYGNKISISLMERTILERYRKLEDEDSYREFLIKNHAVAGPNGLVRHPIGEYCVGHGDGTYDLIIGEFS
jgi:hypothetical protein